MNTHEGHNQPRAVGDILADVVDINSRTIRRDVAAEYHRKQMVTDRLIDILQQRRGEYIGAVRAGQDEAVVQVTVVSAELHHAMADKAILSFNAPPEQP